MPRNRREETDRAIQAAAWRLFRQKGCEAASYTELAQASGVSRPLVQRYYPRKSLLVDACLVSVRDASAEVCDAAYPARVHPLARLYLRGQVNIAAYFADVGTRRFMTDVFASRELTRQTIVDGFMWTVEQTLPEGAAARTQDEPDEVLMATGGLYELVYAYLLADRMPDVPRATMPSVITFGRFCGVDLPEGHADFEEMLQSFSIGSATLQDLAADVVALVNRKMGVSLHQ